MATLDEKIAELNKRYAAALGGRVAELEGYLEGYESSGSFSDLEKLYKNAHAVAGSARTFGLPEVTVKAKELELAARDGADTEILHGKLSALKDCISS
ncbi:Hpt domain-containing protein [Maridesulfovibrio salexigens]|uniref:Hpt protein n=1 Tax=Maridesulfovibrio salexigens (strain ATCC 14822 / DSM 2638 / NCIMB 8403 / VKM B-1763) TaxID=526222 RepID=C6BUQ8_MARSD|nr:Hpt domain-containing protein [Maridesulfovibrio salexigens]ACS81852.1 Hpt protein [Maridesulfovibrio salexigens DSM 2638]